MNSSIWDSSLYISRGHSLEYQNKDVHQSLKSVFISANSADLDEMPHFASILPGSLGAQWLSGRVLDQRALGSSLTGVTAL